MAKKTIEVAEDDFKKVMLILKYSKPFVQLEPTDLFLGNLWRVAPKLADTITKKAGYVFVENKGKKTLKPKDEVPEVTTKETECVDTTKEDEPKNAPAPVEPEKVEEPRPEEAVEETPKVPRCRKRKRK